MFHGGFSIVYTSEKWDDRCNMRSMKGSLHSGVGMEGVLGMLETLHLTKIYKAKGGAPVRALDDVTIQFSTRGMVFLLGKSGSGKSTLLNVCGGLDAPTSGTIVVKGRSSESFSQSDFDSYRNTFVGFIFQEYNVLDEFTVEDNIALALELQGRPKDPQVIADVLAQVDLTGYEKRKPNTLSGGQKQRVAIARALVKSPEIIMADEPTGALDSETGTQVFDTLKRLSQDKLVIVVSHDRDFAETYADRIIELKDGKVISDEAWTDDTRGMSDVENGRFIQSKLPVRHAARIGLSGLKTKPIRLVITVLLCTIGFIFFGLLSTMTFYDTEASFKATLRASRFDWLKMGKEYQVRMDRYYKGEFLEQQIRKGMTPLTEEELEAFREEFGEEAFGVLPGGHWIAVASGSVQYWKAQMGDVAYLPEGHPIRETIKGRYPKNDDEICISSYLAETLYECRIIDPDSGEIVNLSSPEDLIGREIEHPDGKSLIVGIFDSGELPEKYEPLKNPKEENMLLSQEFEDELQDGLHQVMFVTESYMKAYNGDGPSYDPKYDNICKNEVVVAGRLNARQEFILPQYGNGGFDAISGHITEQEIIPLTEEVHMPGKGEAVISREGFYDLIMRAYEKEKADSAEKQAMYDLALALSEGGRYQEEELVPFTEEEEAEYFKQLVEGFRKDGRQITIGMQLHPYGGMDMVCGEVQEYAVIGLWDEDMPEQNTIYGILISDEEYDRMVEYQIANIDSYMGEETNYKKPMDAIYHNVYIPYDHSEEQTDAIWDFHSREYGADDSKLAVSSQWVWKLDGVDAIVNRMYRLFLTAGIVLMVFAALLLSNFISVSISGKKKEIGILRALGARGVDVFKIFFAESLMLTLFCLILAIIGSVIGCAVINAQMIESVGAALFILGPMSYVVMLAVALLTTVLATTLPVWNAARKKPVDSIRAL